MSFPLVQGAGLQGQRLTVSDDLEVRARLGEMPGWYDGVRKSYGAR
ncbi:hypothetical protein V5279_25020 [Bradyrhizobium sp. 26S5]